MSVLKGNINLSNVNVKPNKANKFLQSMMVPFALKAGTIGKLQLKISLLQMWNSPVEIDIDDLFIILGPNYSIVSNEDSYIEEDDQHLNNSYDESNMFNIFEHQLKLRKKTKDEVDKKKPIKRQNTQEQQQWEKQTFDFIKNLKLKINKVHVRYEDDCFNGEFPFSFGVVLDVNNDPLLVLKNCIIENLRVYWNCMSEMYIPTSLWEQTRHLKYQIFEAMEVSDLRGFLLQPFIKEHQETYQYLISSTSVQNQISYYRSEDKLAERTQMSIIMTPFQINITPRMVDDMNNLVELCQNYYLSKDLKQYRPHRRPITNYPSHFKNNPNFMRKKKLIVRQLIQMPLKCLQGLVLLCSMVQLLQHELEANSKYSEILKILENPTTHPNFIIETKGIQLEQYQESQDSKQKSISGLLGEIQVQALSQKLKKDLLQKQTIDTQNLRNDTDNQGYISSFISTNNKTPQKMVDNHSNNNNFSNVANPLLKNLQSPQNQTSQFNLYSNNNTKALVSPVQKQQPQQVEESKSIFGSVLSKVFGFAGSTPDNTNKNQKNNTHNLMNEEYDLPKQKTQSNMSGFGTLLNNSQSLYYTNGMNNNQINSNTLLKQRSSQAINNQQNGVGLRNHIQNNQGNHSKPLINSSRIGSMGQTGIIQDQRLNSASRSIIDLNELRNDPVHQFLMSDLSIKDLRQNINQINQANKGQRQNDQQSNIQKANQVTQSTPQQNKNSNNTLHSNTQIYKGLRDFQGKSQSQNMIPLPQNQIKKQQNTNTQLKRAEPQGIPQNYQIYKELSSTEVIISQNIFSLLDFQRNPDQALFFSQSKTLTEVSQDKSTYKLEVQVGETQVQYSNETLGNLIQFILEYQQLNVFREMQIIQEFFHQSQRRKTSAQRRIELIMPFYIIKKLVHNHQTGQLKQLLSNQMNQQQKQKHGTWEHKLSQVDDQFRNFFFDISFQMQQSTVTMWTDRTEQLCKFSTPQQIQGSAYKHNHDCGFDVLGFTFAGCNSLSVLSGFFQNLFSQVNMMKQHPAISRGIDFYENMHKELKEKQYKMKISIQKAQEQNRLIEYKQKSTINKRQSQEQLQNENKKPPYIKIDQNHKDPSSLKFKNQDVLQDCSNNADQFILLNRYAQNKGPQGDQTVKASMSNGSKNNFSSSIIQNANSVDTIKVVQRIEDQDPVYLQTEEQDDEEIDNSFMIDLDQDYQTNNQKNPQTMQIALKQVNQNEMKTQSNLTSKENQDYMSSNYTTNAGAKNMDLSHNLSSNYSSMHNQKNYLYKEPPQLQPSSIQNLQVITHNETMKTIQSSQLHQFKKSNQSQVHTQNQSLKNLGSTINSNRLSQNPLSTINHHPQQSTQQFQSQSRSLISTGTSQNTQQQFNNGGHNPNQNSYSTKPFAGMIGKPMKSLAQIPNKQHASTSHINQQIGINKPMPSQTFSMGNQILPKQSR
eukprot:403377528